MSQDRMRNIWSFKFRNFLICKLEVESGNRVLEMMRLGCSDDRRGDSRLMQQPGQSHLRGRDTASLCQFFHTIDYAVVRFASVEFVGVVVRLGAQRAGLTVSGK